jgi:hypothetical protein
LVYVPAQSGYTGFEPCLLIEAYGVLYDLVALFGASSYEHGVEEKSFLVQFPGCSWTSSHSNYLYVNIVFMKITSLVMTIN